MEMRENPYFRLCVLLAFQTVMDAKKKRKPKEETEAITVLARQMNAFCVKYTAKIFPCGVLGYANDPGAEATDLAIERHIEELRSNETTRLPKDRETLILFCDRLQQRKSRRMQWAFYAKAKEEALADLVLSYMDEEIEDMAAEAEA